MVLVPDEGDDEAQRAHREREDLIDERRSIVTKIDGSSQDIGRLFARLLLRGFLALPPGFGKPDGDCLLSALTALPLRPLLRVPSLRSCIGG
jgi:hypothetical protein